MNGVPESCRPASECAVLRQLLLALAFLSSVIVVSDYAEAQQGTSWDVMRVYIPEQAVQQVANADFEVMPLEELVDLLKQERTRVEAAEFNVARLDQAIYVASLEEEAVTSEISRWRFRGKTEASRSILDRFRSPLHVPRALSSLAKSNSWEIIVCYQVAMFNLICREER